MTLKHKLKHVHDNMALVKHIQGTYPELRDQLADVWNLLLDHRMALVEKELPDSVLDTHSLRNAIIISLGKRTVYNPDGTVTVTL